MKFGSARFIKEMNKNPDGFQYVNFDWENGTIYGDQWEGDAETELSSVLSPYSNLWYDVDERTIYGQHREGTFEFKILLLVEIFLKFWIITAQIPDAIL